MTILLPCPFCGSEAEVHHTDDSLPSCVIICMNEECNVLVDIPYENYPLDLSGEREVLMAIRGDKAVEQASAIWNRRVK